MTQLTSYLTSRAATGAPPVFARDIRFASPFDEYRDHALITRLFAAMTSVFDELSVVRELGGGGDETATVMRGRVGEHLVDVLLDERPGPDGLLYEATLYLRPLAGIEEAVRRMRAEMRS